MTEYNLFVIYWHSENSNRNDEIISTLVHNINLQIFKKIHVFCQHSCFQKSKLEQITDINLCLVDSRPTYQDIFNYSNYFYTSYNNINILANSDILFDSSVLKLQVMKKNSFFCITRHTLDGQLDWLTYSGEAAKYCSDSQDVWVWRGFNRLKNCNYNLGMLGCDNKIAYDAFDSRYRVYNPSLDIKIFHNHLSEIRDGSSGSGEKDRLSKPYLFIRPQKIEDHYIVVIPDEKMNYIIFESMSNMDGWHKEYD